MNLSKILYSAVQKKFSIPYVEIFKDKKLLDLGCGHGNILQQFSPKNAIGVDNNKLMLQMAKDRGHKNVKFTDLEKGIPFAKETFEAVTAVHFIEHIKNTYFLFDEVYRILRPGGYFYIDTPAANEKFWDDPDHVRPYTFGAIRRLADISNLEIVNWKYSKAYLPFRNSKNSGIKILLQKPEANMELRRRKHFPVKKWMGIGKNYFLSQMQLNRSWLKGLKEYYHWKSEKEFYKAYGKKQKEAKNLWRKKERKTEQDIKSFYAETDYWVLRQTFVHRNNCFPEIADFIPKDRKVWFCEYGGGVGPVTRWLVDRFRNVNFTVVDLPSPQLDFAKFRFKKYPNVEIVTVPENSLPLKKQYDFITCFAVLEHVTQPMILVKHLVKHLKIGGTLFVDFQWDEPEDENLAASQVQRDATINFLNTNLKVVWALDKNWKKDGGFGQYIKMKEV